MKWQHFLLQKSCGQYYKEKRKGIFRRSGTVHERTMQYNEPCSMSLWEGKQDKQHGDYSGYACFRERPMYTPVIWETAVFIRSHQRENWGSFRSIMCLGAEGLEKPR